MSQMLRYRFVRTDYRGARRASPALFVLVLSLLLAGQGCSDDSSGGALTDPCLEFTASGPAVAGAVTTRLVDGSTCDLVTLELVATSIDDVWSLDTTVTFDPSLVAWVGNSTTGSVLGADGTAVAAFIEATASGELTVGISRVAADEGIDIDADGGVLLKLYFSLNTTVAGSGAFSMDDECLTTVGEPPPVIAGVSCSGGTFTVR